MFRVIALSVLAWAVGCGGDDTSPSPPDAAPGGPPLAAENRDHDIDHIGLSIDLGAHTGVATVRTSTAVPAVSLDVGGLTITSVTQAGSELDHRVVDGRLDIGTATGTVELSIDYTFSDQDNFDGWDPSAGVSFLWPTYCENLYPCTTDPDDGYTMDFEVTGAPADSVTVYPSSIAQPAPSYMLAVAVGDYEMAELGTTSEGTAVRVYYPLAQETVALAGTANLVSAFEWLETTIGPYAFGDTVASVSANWGVGGYGGMEHHPFWHVGSASMDSEEVHAHEAAHGWYGNGIRIACWEDFVLSEGLATYLAARALASADVDLWPEYECGLKSVCDGAENTVVLPDSSCNGIDLISHPLWSTAPYMKGAFFLRAVAAEIGEAELDERLGSFYSAHQGEAMRMRDLIAALKDGENDAAIDGLVTSWLETLACPVDTGTLCN